MKENDKYKVIKDLVNHNGNKKRAARVCFIKIDTLKKSY